MEKSLYEILGMKAKHSFYRSVQVTDKFFEGSRVIEIEPYDQTGVNALDTTPSKNEAALNRTEKKLRKVFSNSGEKLLRICVYSNVYDPFEYLLDVQTGKTY